MASSDGKQIKIGAILGYINFFVKMLVQFLYIPIVLRLLGQDEFGVYQLAASFISYLSLLNFGFGGSYFRFYAECKKNKEEEDNLNGSYLVVFLIFGVLVFIVGLILTINSNAIIGTKFTVEELKIAKRLLLILTVNMAISFPASVFSSIVSSRECFIFQKAVELLKTIFNPGLSIIALLLGFASIGIAYVTIVITIADIIVNVWFVIKKIDVGFSFKKFNINLLKKIGGFSFFIFLNSIIDQINWNVDKFLLGRFIGATSITIYSLGAQINNIFIQLSDMLATVMAPRVNIIVSNEINPMPQLNKLWIKIGRLQAMIVFGVLTGFILFGKDFILLWAGNGYDEAYYITLFLIAPVAIPLCQTLGVDIQRALNKHKYRSIVYAFVAIANILISIPMIKLFGAIGAAAGTGIAIVVGNIIIMNIIYKKIIGLNIEQFWKEIIKIIPCILPATVIAIIAKQFYNFNNWGKLIIGCIIFLGIYCVCLFLYGFNNDEKILLKNFVRIKFNRK